MLFECGAELVFIGEDPFEYPNIVQMSAQFLVKPGKFIVMDFIRAVSVLQLFFRFFEAFLAEYVSQKPVCFFHSIDGLFI